ncbi:MAG: type II toxin-antitoxin system prevent-host-death family antitoxin [Chloroflexota bacterium]|nr:type II toxin-antitoxin system prevent-host-death family antitoxin [Chloroflexota bacterium]MDQ5864874.1 type II toxin-antitoxin system prevent-host-death family antitoxin [Chloroflexota bacterium]
MAIETTYTQARAHLAEYLDKAVQDREIVIVHRKNNADAAIIAADDLRSLQETAYLLRSPQNASRLLAALERAQSGEGASFASIEDLRANLGLHESTQE